MSILIRSITIIQPGHDHHNTVQDILIQKGKISKIAPKIGEDGAKLIDGKGKWAMPGLFDLSTHFCDPGEEFKETLESGLKAAADGGFTSVCTQASTQPAIDSKADIEYILGRSRNALVSVHPIGALSKGRKGESLAELLDMYNSGAVAFSDDLKPIKNPALLKLGLLYTRDFGGLVMSFPFDEELSHQGVMNEGSTSTIMGVLGIPNIAEEIMVQRDLYLAEYTDSPIHFSRISSAGSVELIKKARKKGVQVSCDVALANLIYDDSVLEDFDTNFKLLPPLRSSEDRKALLKAVKEGHIDAVVSDHRPQDIEHKVVEFDHAEFGMIGLQTYVSEALKVMDAETIYRVSVSNPRRILGMDVPEISEGKDADLCLIDPNLVWNFDEHTNLSLSRNSPLFGKSLTGRSIGIVKGSNTTL
jgi:dihydroorotase